MAVEIEHKFLVNGDSWKNDADAGTFYRQGYLASTADSGIRVSIDGEHASLTIKKAQSARRRLEFEYAIPKSDAEEMLTLLCAQNQLEKTRYRIPFAGHVWEVDVFSGLNSGLVVAEVELEREDELFELPAWVGEDVSEDERFYAMNLARTPFTTW